MADKGEMKKPAELGIKSEGSIWLKLGIAIMVVILIWSLVVPQQEREERTRIEKLTRAKMKALFQLQFAYLTTDTVYATDLGKLVAFARTADTSVVPDSLFAPVKTAYARFEDRRASIEPMPLVDFKKAFLDSLIVNPFTGEPFIVEITTKAGRRTFNILPSKDEDAVKIIGAVKEGEITWDERADLTN
jgi:hypothetical protein